jgi:trans-2,3-dihydro-3-hydroxyanthranilate isomerase
LTGLEYQVVDVFTRTPLEGNPLAVFTDGAALDDSTMQRIAKELNLSETAFILPPTRADCDIRVRIFTPIKEMAFAGHPTIGSAYVARSCGLVSAGATGFALEELIGRVPIRVETGEDPRLWLRTPPILKQRHFDPASCAQAVGLDAGDLLPDVPCEIWTAGNPNLYIAVRDRAAVDRAQADTLALNALYAREPEPICTFVFAPVGTGAYSRMFAPNLGVPEDPATGSATGPLAAFMLEYGLAPGSSDGTSFISEQGVKMGRRSELHIRLKGERGKDGIEIGGHVAPIVRASMTLPAKWTPISRA